MIVLLGLKMPYMSIPISKERFDKIKDSKCSWYEIDGKKLFDIKDENGNKTGETMAFLVFREEENK